MDRPTHAPDSREGTVLPQGSLDILDREITNPDAEGQLGGRHHLGLDAASVRDDPGDLGLRQRTIEMVSRHPERMDLRPCDRRSGSRLRRGHAVAFAGGGEAGHYVRRAVST